MGGTEAFLCNRRRVSASQVGTIARIRARGTCTMSSRAVNSTGQSGTEKNRDREPPEFVDADRVSSISVRVSNPTRSHSPYREIFKEFSLIDRSSKPVESSALLKSSGRQSCCGSAPQFPAATSSCLILYRLLHVRCVHLSVSEFEYKCNCHHSSSSDEMECSPAPGSTGLQVTVSTIRKVAQQVRVLASVSMTRRTISAFPSVGDSWECSRVVLRRTTGAKNDVTSAGPHSVMTDEVV